MSDNGSRALMAIDDCFHWLVYESAYNQFLAEALIRLHAPSFRLWYLALDQLDGVKGAVEQHVVITGASKDADGLWAKARHAMQVRDLENCSRKSCKEMKKPVLSY